MHVSLALEPLSRGGRLKVDHHGDLPLRFDSQTKHLKLFAKEKFSNDDNYVLTVRPRPQSPGTRVRPRAFPPRPHRLASTESPTTRAAIFQPPRPSLPDADPALEPRSLQVSGSLDTKDGRVESRAYVRKKFFPEAFLSRVDMGLSYATTQDDAVQYGVAGKKSFELTDDGLTTLDIKGGMTMGSRARGAEFDGRVELTQKIFNFQEDQDLKLRLGFNVGERSFYGQIRENNWTFNTDFKDRWDVRYDL